MAEEPNTSMEQAGDEGDQEVVTLEEVLESQQQLMDDANAVLGAIDDKKCTYSEGYMKRQALYSCLTCIPEARSDPSKSGGVCLACSYYCHEGHELIELYTKRNFRCDCGNVKFPNRTCSLDNSKSDVNELNQYNQNFSGLYCTCNRPYPDPEDPVEDDMIQCIICEDWYHSRHLGTEVPPQSSYTEMTCEACVKKHEFLLHYEGFSVTKISPGAKKEIEVEVATVTSTTEDDGCAKPDDTEKMEVSEDVSNAPINTEETSTIKEFVNDIIAIESAISSINTTQSVCSINITEPVTSINPSGAVQDAIPISEVKNEAEVCKMLKLKLGKVSTKFWGDAEWRKQLCTCLKCMKMYEDERVTYLLDPQDTVPVYEEKGKAKAREFEAKQHDNDMKFLNSLDRVPLMEAIAGFNDMKTNLMEYLKKFAENRKVVREEDIREFFSNYDAKKKQKCEIPQYCR